jgi:hypothetical protein
MEQELRFLKILMHFSKEMKLLLLLVKVEVVKLL